MQDTSDTTWLVVGGAGYVGSHVVEAFLKHGLGVVVLDDLTTGIRDRVPQDVKLKVGDATNSNTVRTVLGEHRITGIVHLAAKKQARESSEDPHRYWTANIGASLGITRALAGSEVRSFIMSSSCSVYGDSAAAKESSPLAPLSPYARTKLASEWIIQDSARQLGVSVLTFRYFNVIGNSDFPVAHDVASEALVPNIWRAFHAHEPLTIHGTDFPTADGTALRDFVDVRDVARAHALGAVALQSRQTMSDDVFNLGSGEPVSVATVVKTAGHISGHSPKMIGSNAHEADPVQVWAESTRARNALGWVPQYTLEESLRSYQDSLNAKSMTTPRVDANSYTTAAMDASSSQ